MRGGELCWHRHLDCPGGEQRLRKLLQELISLILGAFYGHSDPEQVATERWSLSDVDYDVLIGNYTVRSFEGNGTPIPEETFSTLERLIRGLENTGLVLGASLLLQPGRSHAGHRGATQQHGVGSRSSRDSGSSVGATFLVLFGSRVPCALPISYAIRDTLTLNAEVDPHLFWLSS